MTIRKFSLGVAAFAAATAAAMPAQAKETIKVAVPSFLSGPAAGPFGVPARNGAELVLNAINAGTLPAPYNTKGFAGATAEVTYVDENGGNTKQVAEYRNLVQKHGADVIIGYISSGTCAALAPVIEELKTLTVMAICGTPRIFEEAERKYSFRTMSHATADGVAAALYVRDKFPKLKTYTAINQNYAWGQDSWRDFDLSMQQLVKDSKASDTIQFPKFLAGQYGSEISALSLDKSELLHSSLWGGDLESFVLQAGVRGLFKQKQVLLTVGGTAAYRLNKNLPDGVILGSRGPYGILVRDRKTALNEWFIKNYKDVYGTYPSDTAYQYAQAVLGAKVAYDKAAQKAGGFPNTDQVIAAFEGMEFESFSTQVKMSLAKGHQAVTEQAYGIVQWNEKENEIGVKDVVFYPANCVMPPEGVESVEWIKGGLKGSTC